MNEKIPHIIHFFWFGEKKKPAVVKKCIKSWKRNLPDWEIKEWNEFNYDISKNNYILEAYQKKKWAFVADYARFDILEQYGGINLDTDVEMIKPLSEEMLILDAFTGFESLGKVAPGLIFASKPHTQFLKEILSLYEHIEKFTKEKTICDYVTELLQSYGLIMNGKRQTILNVTVFPSEFFCAFNLETRRPHITEKTYSIHLYYGSWLPKRKKFKFWLIGILSRLLGERLYIRIKRMFWKFKY